jgi:hypothetical protein
MGENQIVLFLLLGRSLLLNASVEGPADTYLKCYREHYHGEKSASWYGSDGNFSVRFSCSKKKKILYCAFCNSQKKFLLNTRASIENRRRWCTNAPQTCYDIYPMALAGSNRVFFPLDEIGQRLGVRHTLDWKMAAFPLQRRNHRQIW